MHAEFLLELTRRVKSCLCYLEPVLYDTQITCPYCFESFWIEVDPSAGDTQHWIVDCEVCCHPIDVSSRWDAESDGYLCTVERAQ